MPDEAAKGYIFATIFTLANKLQVIGDRFDPNVTIKQWLFLVGLSTCKEPPMVSEVSDLIGYSRQNAKRIALMLEQTGFVKVIKDPKDNRILRIILTEACRDYFSRRYDKEVDSLNALFSGLDSGLIKGLGEGLKALETNVERILHNESHGYEEG
jgi:DNA-binding MarR family transcriptional regulator